jgi:hypothetical protein
VYGCAIGRNVCPTRSLLDERYERYVSSREDAGSADLRRV